MLIINNSLTILRECRGAQISRRSPTEIPNVLNIYKLQDNFFAYSYKYPMALDKLMWKGTYYKTGEKRVSIYISSRDIWLQWAPFLWDRRDQRQNRDALGGAVEYGRLWRQVQCKGTRYIVSRPMSAGPVGMWDRLGTRRPETKRPSEWLPCSSLETLKSRFNVSSNDQGSHPDDPSVSVREIEWEINPCLV